MEPSKSHKRVAKLAADNRLMKSVIPGYEGKALKYEEYSDTSNLNVSKLYQRLLSINALKKYKKLDLKLLIPAVIARRPESLGPNGGDWLIDGQHKAVLFFLSGAANEGITFPAMVYEHDENVTLQECEEIEADIFYALNTQRKKLTKIDEIRAGVVFKDPTSLWIERVLLAFSLNADGFGYDGDSAKELKSFNQFHIAVTSDYPMDKVDSFERLQSGFNLSQEMFPNENYLSGPMFRTCCLLAYFLDEVLDNGRQENFYNYLTQVLPLVENQTTLCKGFIDANASRFIFFNIIDKYSIYCGNKNLPARCCLGQKTWENAVKVSPRFKRPDA